MKAKYYPPTYQENQFNCIHCNVFASQKWNELKILSGTTLIPTSFSATFCCHCSRWSFWHEDRMIIPSEAPVEPAHPDLPEDCLPEYTEARDIFARSPRASAALLRLCIQKLLRHLGEKGKNINDDIKALVGKGLPAMVQQALDYCRVVGNNAVHPGEIELNSTPDVAQHLFKMINFIVEDRITRPREIAALYSELPESSLEAIEKRDGAAPTTESSATSS
jgi:hypothetical protein